MHERTLFILGIPSLTDESAKFEFFFFLHKFAFHITNLLVSHGYLP